MSKDDNVDDSDEFKSRIETHEGFLVPDGISPLSSSDVIEPMRKVMNKVKHDSNNGTHEANNSKFDVRLGDAEITALSGAVSGFVSGIVVCPLDVAKTRLQAQGLQSTGENRYYKGLIGTFTTIVRDEGVRGLYKGLVPIIMGYFPTWMIYFSFYELCKDFYPRIIPQWDFVSYSCSAITAGAVSTIVTNPIWVIKTRLMLQTHVSQNPTHYKGTFDAFKKIYSQEGIKALYAGLVPSFLGLLHVAIYFPVYEKLKIAFNCYHTQKGVRSRKQDQTLDLSRLIMASCVSKMIASVITYPHEILRTRMQLKSDLPNSVQHKLVPLARTTYLTEGLRGFYSGFATNLVRTVPASAITLVSFEYVRNHLTNINDTASTS